jgi:uncharacterized membrane protein YkvA (DUF1232 family)
MPLSVTLEFTDADLDHLRALVQRVRAAADRRTPQEICTAAAAQVERLRDTACSSFVAQRIDRVGRLVAMLNDPEWRLPEPERRRVLDGLAYLAETQDLVPDNAPLLGLVDDAIVLELVLGELRPELDGYAEFDAYRRDEAARRDKPGTHRAVSVDDWLAARREALHARIRERRDRDLARNGEAFRLITRF